MRFGGVATVLVATAAAGCGLLMLGGVGPAGTDSAPSGDRVTPVASTQPLDGATATTVDSSADTTSSTSTTTTTTSTTTATSTTSTTTTTTTVPARPSPVPLSVSASQRIVGAGGVVTFDGTCPVASGDPLGPVVLWIVGAPTQVVRTGVTAEVWTYDWTAPVDESEFSSFTFQFWCGDPTGFTGGYPVGLQQIVDMVAIALPVTTTIPPPVQSAPPAAVIPETD